MNIQDIEDYVVESTNRNWSLNAQIRYVYVTLGKYLQTNTDFFLSMYGKLKEQNLEIDELKKIYNSTGDSRKVICKSSAHILKRIFDRLGIESKMMETCDAEDVLDDANISRNEIVEKIDNDLIVNHWFIAVKGDEDKTYFLTLTVDLPYIQQGFRTHHFATNIPYMRVDNNTGIYGQTYKGEEIHHSTMNDTDIYNLDVEIGYLKNQYYDGKNWVLAYNDESLNMLRHINTQNKEYLETTEEETDFYRSIYSFNGVGGRPINLGETPLSEITYSDWQIWIKIICKKIQEKILSSIDYQISFDNNPKIDIKSDYWDFQEWYKYFKTNLNSIDLTKYAFPENYSPLNLLGQSKALKSSVENEVIKIAKFKQLMHFTAYQFVPIEYLPNDNYCTNAYIHHKLGKMFQLIFNENTINEFNEMNYGEQTVILQGVIDTLFPELTKQNSNALTNYDDSLSPTRNRIRSSALKNRETGEYKFLLGIIGSNDEPEYYYFFDQKTNELKNVDVLSLSLEYVIVSSKFKPNIENVENIETKTK